MTNKKKGFTLVELVITIAIVIILSVISVPIYRGYTTKAMYSEGYALLGTILSAQKSYYSEYGTFLYSNWGSNGGTGWSSYNEVLGIDARGNRYFTSFGTGYIGGEADIKYRFGACVVKPAELRKSQNLSLIVLSYDLTTGAKIEDDRYHY